MLAIPAGIQDLLISREICIGYLLAGTNAAIAIFKCQFSAALFDAQAHQYKPVCCAKFQQVAGSSIHQPKRTCRVREVFGAGDLKAQALSGALRPRQALAQSRFALAGGLHFLVERNDRVRNRACVQSDLARMESIARI